MEQNDEKPSMTRQDIEQHLQSALAAATPNVWPKLDLSVPQDRPEKVSGILRLEKRFRRWGAAAACICLIAAGGFYHYEYLQVVSVIGIDVNPSLRLSLNRREKVLKAEALNLDGEEVLDGNLKGKTLESALGQVVDALVEKGYLKEGQREQAVLLSVSGKSEKQAEEVKTAATANVEDAIAQNQVSAIVYDQTIQVTKELEELAETYQVSVGKAGFIEQLVQENESLNQDAQAAYARMMTQSMEVITQEINANAYAVSPRVNVIQVEPVEEKNPASTGNGTGSRADEKENFSATETVRSGSDSKNPEEKSSHNLEGSQTADDSWEENGMEESHTDSEADRGSKGEAEVKENGEEHAKTQEDEGESIRKDTSDGALLDVDKADRPENEPEQEGSSGSEKGEEASLSAREPLKEAGEATSSTAGPETEALDPEREKDLSQPESQENLLEEENNPKKQEEGKLTGQEEDFFVKYGQSVKDGILVDERDLPDNEREFLEEILGGRQEETEIAAEGKGFEEESPLKQPLENDQDKPELPEDEAFAEKTLEGEASINHGEEKPETESPTEENEEKQTSLGNTALEDNVVEAPEGIGKEEVRTEDKDTSEVEEASENKGTPKESTEDEIDVERVTEDKDGAKRESEDKINAERVTEDKIDAERAAEDKNGAKREAEDKNTDKEEVEKGPSSDAYAEGESGHQVIRVKVEKKEWKEPVYASQLLGFSQSRLLCEGPGVFDFIIADPGKRNAEEEGSEDEQEYLEEEDSWAEEDEEGLFEAEEDEEAMEEWEAEMEKWSHVGPGYLLY